MNFKQYCFRFCGLAAGVIFTVVSSFGAMPITTTRVASGLSLPLYVTAPPGDTQRLFIVEQVSAQIKILQNGQILPTPFVNLNSLVINNGGEQGLLGLAFHPNYAGNGFFYVNYTANSGNSVTARYQVSANPNVANPNSAQILLDIPDPYSNHNGGCLGFGPDGYLYLGLGDGGNAFDPQNRAQNGLVMWGKMLRLDVNNSSPYAIPANNPFVGNPNMLPEIWSIGLRNPWRWSFDRANGNMYIGDVGQNTWEEVDYQPAGVGGQNWGWRIWEGNHSTGLTGLSTIVPTVTFPIHEYDHTAGNCSVTGGYVYRGSAIPDLQGTYFFGDYCSASIWSFRYNGASLTAFQDRTAMLAPPGGLNIGSISSFGEDASGELYICDLSGGEVFKIIPALDITLTPVNPPITIPATGGSFSFNVQIQNRSTYSLAFNVWIMQQLPNGAWQGPLLGPVALNIPANISIVRLRSQNVPGSAPPGTYTYRGYAGLYASSTKWDSSSFTYTKSASGTGPGITNWDNGGESFAPYEINASIPVVIPSKFGLEQNYPNPFNPTTTIGYQLSSSTHVSLRVYDLPGRLITTLVDDWKEAGSYQVVFDGRELASGQYFVHMETGAFNQVREMMLLK
jgi:glucose/arabinose dehydrogenase